MGYQALFPAMTTAGDRLTTTVSAAGDARPIRISLTGEIDVSTSDHVLGVVLGVLNRHRPGRLDIDLTRVTFMDASGVNALVRLLSHAGDMDCRLVAVGPQPMVERVLRITGVLHRLTGGAGPTPAPAEPSSAPRQRRRVVGGPRPDPAPDAGLAVAACVREARLIRGDARRARERAAVTVRDSAEIRARLLVTWAGAAGRLTAPGRTFVPPG